MKAHSIIAALIEKSHLIGEWPQLAVDVGSCILYEQKSYAYKYVNDMIFIKTHQVYVAAFCRSSTSPVQIVTIKQHII